MSAQSKGQQAQVDTLTDHTQPHIKKHYYNIFDDALAVMLIVDPKSGQIVDANLAAERFYGWSRARLRQMHISEINTLPLDQLRAQLEAGAEGSGPLRCCPAAYPEDLLELLMHGGGGEAAASSGRPGAAPHVARAAETGRGGQ